MTDTERIQWLFRAANDEFDVTIYCGSCVKLEGVTMLDNMEFKRDTLRASIDEAAKWLAEQNVKL